MPLIITCTECKNRYALSEFERSIFWKVTPEERADICCPNCREKQDLDGILVGKRGEKVVSKFNNGLYLKAVEIIGDDGNMGLNHFGRQGIGAFVDWLESTYKIEEK